LPSFLALLAAALMISPITRLVNSEDHDLNDLRTRLNRLTETLLFSVTGMLMGHGERPFWVLLWVIAIWAVWGLTYSVSGALPGWWSSFHWSALLMISPGSIAKDAAGWFKNAALIQSFTSYILLALFLGTFVRKVAPK